MARLTELRDAATRALCEALPDLRIEAFSGDITVEALARKCVQAGVSVLVAAMEAENDAPSDTLDFEAMGAFAAIVVSSNAASPEMREADALAVAEDIALLLHGQTFGLSDVSPARVTWLMPVRNESFVKDQLDVWTVAWFQQLVFGNTD